MGILEHTSQRAGRFNQIFKTPRVFEKNEISAHSLLIYLPPPFTVWSNSLVIKHAPPASLRHNYAGFILEWSAV